MEGPADELQELADTLYGPLARVEAAYDVQHQRAPRAADPALDALRNIGSELRAAHVRLVGSLAPARVSGERSLPRLSEPFRRLRADRVGSERGAGLGLSMVAAVAGGHDGEVDARPRPGGRLEVVVTLPEAA